MIVLGATYAPGGGGQGFKAMAIDVRSAREALAILASFDALESGVYLFQLVSFHLRFNRFVQLV